MSIKIFIARIYYFLKLWNFIFSAIPYKIRYKENFKFLLFTPKHGNLGDHAIAKAEKEIFKYFYIFEITEADLVKILKYNCFPRALQLLFGRYDLLIHGGGFIGTLWEYCDDMVLALIENQPDNRIFILPQTIYYENDEHGLSWLDKAMKVYNSHSQLTLCVREKVSYKIGKKFFGNTYLIPDMVLYLDECKSDIYRDGAVISLRCDTERTMDDAMHDRIVEFAMYSFKRVIFADMYINSAISIRNRERRLNEQFDKFRGAELVITDRLHGMIFAAITGTPCAVLNSKSHKVKGVYDWCLSDLEYIRFVDSVEEISEFYNQIKGKTFVYDNTKLKPYYEKLLELIK